MKILLTAFDPFGGADVNPAELAVSLVPPIIGDIEVIKLIVPTVFGKSIKVVVDAIDTLEPDAVLCIGQAGGRFGLTPERVAINIDDARIKDNEGNQPIDTAIFQDGAPAYFTTLPIKTMTAKMREAGLPSYISNSAGVFVCNHLMYGVLYHLSKKHPTIRGGFMHVPYVHSQVTKLPAPAPSMSEEDIARGIKVAIEAIAEKSADNYYIEGDLH